MSDDSPGPDARRPLFERLAALLLRVPEDREQLLGVLRQAHDRSLLDADALSMIEGVLQVAELSAIDVMVPRAQMDVIDVSEPPEVFLPKAIATAHSRFPVVEGDRDNARYWYRRAGRGFPALADLSAELRELAAAAGVEPPG